MDKVRFGVVGLGNMGSGHTRNLFEGKIPGAVLTAVCDIKPDRLDWARGICGDSVAYFADSHEMIKSGLVDAVMIATPHYFHPIIGIDAFENGLNVLSDFCHQCREHGSTLLVCGVQPQPLDVIRHAPFYRELKRYNICENIDAALNRARKIINGPAPKHL